MIAWTITSLGLVKLNLTASMSLAAPLLVELGRESLFKIANFNLSDNVALFPALVKPPMPSSDLSSLRLTFLGFFPFK